jgi:GNAT superfamily N-acetyltransferase
MIELARRGQGLGSALIADTIAYARARGAAGLKSEVRENDPAALRFAQRLGFNLDRHIFESVLDLERFDAAPFRTIEERVAASGIRILSLAEVGFTRENLRKLHAVNYATALDIPGAEPSWMPFEEFARMVMDDKAAWFRPAGQFGALNGEEWVGLSAVQLDEQTHSSYNLMTGVLPAYRGRGIALALKLTAIRYARAAGASAMRTHNDSLNAPMLAVNRKLGYVPRPGKYILRG